MQHEGMVHALSEVRRVLRDGGRFVDLRPIVCHPAVDVLSGEGEAHAGRLDDSTDQADQDACERALSYARAHRWFRQLAAEDFSYSIYWDTPAEMLEYLAANWEEIEVPEEVVLRAQRLADLGPAPVQVRVRLAMRIVRYESLSP
jgi:hypothetical protein